ncbi:F1F0 ATPase subunit 2 [Humitalea rosea]|uniref:F1F0 ATPase subunit 2 n=1 Tax=Humitalea rosea TaxID=990373 RepID=A0A2W7HXP2_9PROT|nr:ATP synthase subunit I [Humitalea rosea]PZW39336.1 F1F0 ATPase subunit 2 [Humitalea rosea]
MMALTDPLWALAGLLLGAVHFSTLRHNTGLYLTGGMAAAVALHLARMVIVVAGLVLVGMRGAWPLIFALGGLLLARSWIVRPERR